MAQMKAFGILNKNLASDFPPILFRSSVMFFVDVIKCKHPKWINSTFEKYKVFSLKHLGFPSLNLMNFPNPETSPGIIPMPRDSTSLSRWKVISRSVWEISSCPWQHFLLGNGFPICALEILTRPRERKLYVWKTLLQIC